MSYDCIDYENITNEALCSVPYKALLKTQEEGLIGKHYFIITFNVNCKGVNLSKRLRENYPSEMALLIKSEFKNLKVSKQSFAISIDILGSIEEITVPFNAMISFSDPSIHFGLKFKNPNENASSQNQAHFSEAIAEKDLGENVVSFEQYRMRKKTKATRRSL